MKRQRLGRGLDAMFPAAQQPPEQSASAARPPPGNQVPVEELHPNRSQPRRHFDADALAELSDSIRELGVLEPILVRHRAAGGLEIIAGERRWRAAQKAGLKEVPVFIRDLSEKDAFEAALVENIQREDLNPIETALAFQRLLEEHGHTQDTVAERVGKKRSTVSNALRLLRLPESVLQMIEHGQLSEGHGRAILAATSPESMERLARRAASERWSVRQTERAARSKSAKANTSGTGRKSANIRDLERRLGQSLGTTVIVRDRHGKGRLEVSFASYEELDRVITRLLG